MMMCLAHALAEALQGGKYANTCSRAWHPVKGWGSQTRRTSVMRPLNSSQMWSTFDQRKVISASAFVGLKEDAIHTRIEDDQRSLKMQSSVAGTRLTQPQTPLCSPHWRSVNTCQCKAPRLYGPFRKKPLGSRSDVPRIPPNTTHTTGLRRASRGPTICCSYQTLNGCSVKQASTGEVKPILSLWEVNAISYSPETLTSPVHH